MALPFPVVPIALGVPPLPRLPGIIILPPPLLTFDSGRAQSVGRPQWGLFLNGQPAVVADSVLSFSYKQDWIIADYPLEGAQGTGAVLSFESYDKVQVPFDVRLRFTAGGSDADRQALLRSVDAAAGSLNLYDAVTPEATYVSVNPTHYDYRRTNTNGVGLITIDVWCTQVIVTATSKFTQTQQPGSADPIGIGGVQAAGASTAQTAAVPQIN